MPSPARGSRPSLGSLGRFLFGLVAVVVVTDVALLFVTPAGEVAELVRVALVALALFAVALGIAVAAVRNPIYAPLPFLCLPLVAVYGYTGLLLPWTQLSFALGRGSLELLLSVPVAGEPLAIVLLGGTTLTQATLRTAFRYHYAIVFAALIGLCCLAGWAVWSRRLAGEAG